MNDTKMIIPEEEKAKMRFKKWLTISLGLHLLVGAAYAVSLVIGPNYEDMTAVELQASSHPKNQESPPQFADEGEQAKKKPTIETNKQPAVQNEPSGDTGDYTDSYNAEEPPVAISAINPVYPENARRQGIEGKVMMYVYIDSDGFVRKVDVVKSPNPMLAESAMKAVSEAKFRPARVKGIFKAVRMLLTLKFKLE